MWMALGRRRRRCWRVDDKSDLDKVGMKAMAPSFDRYERGRVARRPKLTSAVARWRPKTADKECRSRKAIATEKGRRRRQMANDTGNGDGEGIISG